ncbi:MAG: MBL fold metallo-hydrolase [Chloroflexota bacterium]
MIVEFFGVRGGIPAPGPKTARVGGNTPCVKVTTKDGHIIILDAGTGIRPLGDQLILQSGDVDRIIATLFISHTHWDHIQGFPFFGVLRQKKNRLLVFGEERIGRRLEEVIAGQVSEPYLPFGYGELEADILIKEARENDVVVVGENTRVTAKRGFHPGGVFMYRIEDDQHSIVYATDIGHPIGGYDYNVIELANDCDLLIHDAQFSSHEKMLHPDWGHSTWIEAALVGIESSAKSLALFHHNAWADDEFLLNTVEKEAQAVNNLSFLACEGIKIDLG